MGKLAPRLASRKKAKRWARGQSSSSNPETTKYREQAIGMFFKEAGSAGTPGITREDVRKHDAIQGVGSRLAKLDIDLGTEEESTVDGTASTRDTFASDYSACSNLSFGRFLARFQSSSIVHKEMLAVLAAVTEVIKQNGGKESSTEYFAALMSTLEATEEDTSVAAVLSLLGMCLRTVPRSVLNLQFGPTSQVLLQILSRYASAGENHLVPRHCLGCLSVLLREQEAAVWADASTARVLDAVLSFTTHAKPKVRKCAQHGIRTILGDAGIATSRHHPAAGRVAAHCVAQLDAACEPGSSLGATTILHTLTLLANVVAQLPKSHVKTICERLLSIMTLSNVLVTSCCLQTFHGLFAARPSEASLPFPQNASIVRALYDYQPSASDTQPTLAWLAVLREAHCNLARLAHSGAVPVSTTLEHVVPEMLDRCVELLLSSKAEVVAGASHTVETILQECVAPLCDTEERRGRYGAILRHVVEAVHKTLSYRYLGAWRHVLRLTAVLLRVTGSKLPAEQLANVVRTLGDLRDVEDYARDVEYAVGAAIRAMGPRAVLDLLPLAGNDGHVSSIDLGRSWLIPLLKDCVTGGSIALFKDTLLPLALRCEQRAKESPADGKAYECLVTQIWSVLPSLCNDASDVASEFQHVARLLGVAIGERRDLRLPAMAALRRLTARASAEPDRAELARFAKNYLPILFNLYTTKPDGTDEEGVRLAAFDTIKAYMTIASNDLANELFDRALSKLDEPEADEFFKESVHDLLRALLGHADADRLSKHYDACVPALEDDTGRWKEQKKAYRFLEEVCGSEREVCERFLHEHRRQIQRTLVSTATSVARTSRGARLRCLVHLVERHPRLEGTKFLEAVVPEAVLCVKDINERCRAAAYRLLDAIARKFINDPSHLAVYLDMLMVGLGGDREFVSASLLALASVTHSHYGSLGAETLDEILGHVCTILASPTRGTAESALSYVKVYINVTPFAALAPTLPRLVGALSRMTEDCKRHLRQKVRDIFTKLMRKYGYAPISAMLPASDVILHKRLKNMSKVEEAKRKRRELERARKLEQRDSHEEFDAGRRLKSIEEILADSDDEFEATELEDARRSKKRTSVKDAWIQESGDSIVDLADPAAARNITTTQPVGVSNRKLPERKVKDRGFATAPDGRLIITDDNEKDSDAEERKQKKRKKEKTVFLQSDSEDDYKDRDDASIVASKSAGKKRKYSESTLDAMSSKSQSTSRYRDVSAGGSGIHRTLKAIKVDCEPGSEYRATKARGDIKRKDKPDPYAYVPLTRSILNKRKKKKNAGKFQSIVSGARKGARAGLRNKRRKR